MEVHIGVSSYEAKRVESFIEYQRTRWGDAVHEVVRREKNFRTRRDPDRIRCHKPTCRSYPAVERTPPLCQSGRRPARIRPKGTFTHRVSS
jgi:hypothetical protein